MELEWKEELDRNDWKKSTPALTIAGSQGHINNYWIRHTLFLTDEHTQSFMCNGQINEHMSCEQWHNYFHTNYTHLFSAKSESIDTSLTHIMPLFSLLQVESPVRFDWVIRHWVRKKYSRRHICNTCHHKIGEIYMNDSIWWLFIPNVALSSVPMHRYVAGTILLQNRIASTSATWRQWCLPCQWCWHRPQHF